MRNINFAIEDNSLILKIDLKVKPERSRSGQSLVLASSCGNSTISLPDGTLLKANINIFRDAPQGSGR